jgi:hypothetical protein
VGTLNAANLTVEFDAQGQTVGHWWFDNCETRHDSPTIMSLSLAGIRSTLSFACQALDKPAPALPSLFQELHGHASQSTNIMLPRPPKLSINRTARLSSRVLARLIPGAFTSRLDAPVFIVGFSKSGKTLIRNILNKHPEVNVYPEEANEIWHPTLYPWHKYRGSTPPMWIDGKQFISASLSDWTAAYQRRIKAHLGAYHFLTRRKFLIIDSAMIAMLLPSLSLLFPDAKFIHVYRDGRIASFLAAERQYKKYLHHPEAYHGVGLRFGALDEVYELMARHWVEVIEAVDMFRINSTNTSSRMLELSYEEFCASPSQQTARILEFIGAAPISLDAKRVTNRNSHDFERIPKQNGERVQSILTGTLASKGYFDAQGPLGLFPPKICSSDEVCE